MYKSVYVCVSMHTCCHSKSGVSNIHHLMDSHLMVNSLCLHVLLHWTTKPL